MFQAYSMTNTCYFRWDHFRLHLGHADPTRVFEVLSDTFKDLATLSYLSDATWEVRQSTDLTGYTFMGKLIFLFRNTRFTVSGPPTPFQWC